MPLVNASAFAKLAGVSKVAISKAVNATPPRLIKTGDLLDTDNPVNAMYLAGAHQGAKGRATVAPKPTALPKAAKAPDPEDAAFQKAVRKRQAKKAAVQTAKEGMDELSPDERAAVQENIKQTVLDLMGDTVSLDREKKVVDIALKKSMERRHSLKFAQDKGLLVRREDVRRTLAHFNSSLSTNILQAPRSAVPTLFAMAKAGASTQEGIVALEKILGLAVAHVLDDTADAI